MKNLFEDWPRAHYIQNVYIAITAWLATNPDMDGTPVQEQMRDIRSQAELEYSNREASRGPK
jgi:hypothetical protein